MIARTFTRPNLIPLLWVATGLLLAVYVALMVTTILLAALQTELAQQVQEERMLIATLEEKYYDGVAALDSTSPAALGYVTPTSVRYVTAAPMPNNLTFAD